MAETGAGAAAGAEGTAGTDAATGGEGAKGTDAAGLDELTSTDTGAGGRETAGLAGGLTSPSAAAIELKRSNATATAISRQIATIMRRMSAIMDPSCHPSKPIYLRLRLSSLAELEARTVPHHLAW